MMPAMPRVMRNEGTRSRVVSRPFARPTSRPTPRAAGTAMNMFVSRSSTAATIALSATIWPMERSISPAERANVMPKAMIDTKAVWRRMLRKLSRVRKPLSRSVIENTARMSTKPR